jgi:hypothetical protein
MKSYKTAKVCGLAVLCGAALALLVNSEASAQGMRGSSSHRSPDAVEILNGVGNMVGQIIRSTHNDHHGGNHGGQHHGMHHHGRHRPPRPPVVYDIPLVSSNSAARVTPIGSAPSAVASNPLPTAEITLRNPNENGVTLKFSLSGVSYSLPPGYTQKIHQVCVIKFDRGGSAGTARYTLSEGTYKFQAARGAWDLFKDKADVARAEETSGLTSNAAPAQ